MSVMAYLDGIATFLALSCALPVTLFIAFYAARSDWRSTPPGRALMYQSIAMIAVLVVIGLSIVFGTDYPGRHIVRVAGYAFLAFTLWRTFFVLLRYQGHPDDAPGDTRHMRVQRKKKDSVIF